MTGRTSQRAGLWARADTMGTVSGQERRALVLRNVNHTLIENGGVSKANYALAYTLF
jgi:hypothetical protein